MAQAAKIADTGMKEFQSSIAGATMASTADDKDVHQCTSECSARTKDNTNRDADYYRSGAKHIPDQCCFKLVKCHVCGKLGHIVKVCQTKKNFQTSDSDAGTPKPTHQVVELSSNTTEYNMLLIGCQEGRPLQTTIVVNKNFYSYFNNDYCYRVKVLFYTQPSTNITELEQVRTGIFN